MDERKPPSSRGDSELEALIESFAERIRGGESPSIEEYAARYPHLADRIREVFPSLEFVEKVQREEPRSAEDASIPAAAATVDGKTLERLGDYRILREIGRGGMGIVYEAEQESLGRHVALKVLPFHRLMHPKYLERFLREARAAAALQHPNIVPVYNVGVEEDIHYYAMQFIVGQGLDQVLEEIRRLRKARGPAEGATPSSSASSTTVSWFGGSAEAPSASDARYFKSVARIGLKVAEALSYAHGQGLLHRDIKPSNLLLDAKGDVWVTDFGLAKVEGSDDITHTGEVVGTLRYMAPERFRGWSDPRSDIYSLGLTLYELLTLQPAFEDTDRGRLVKRIAEDDPARPRRLDAHVPRDLETIVTKSIAKEPGQRYQTADELAADLGHFLAGEPIRARASTVWERGVKWAKRRPALSGMIGLSTVALCALFVGVLWYNARLRAAVTETGGAREQAEANFQKAREAVDKILTRVGEEKLAKIPRMEAVRREILEEALAFYLWFSQERGSDPSVRLETARAHQRVGEIYEKLGDNQKAEAQLREAIQIFEDLLPEASVSILSRRYLVESMIQLACTLFKTARHEEAEILFRRALLLAEEISADSRQEQAVICSDLAGLLDETSRPGEAEVFYRRAMSLRRSLADSNPDVPGYLDGLATTMNNLALLLFDSARFEEAEDLRRQGSSIGQKLIEQFPDSPEYRQGMARNLIGYAVLLMETGRPEEAVKAYRDAMVHQRRLKDDFPGIPEYRHELAITCHNLAVLMDRLGKKDEAEGTFREAAELEERLTTEVPDVSDYIQMLVKTYNSLALLDGEKGHAAEARKRLERARDLMEGLSAQFAERPDYQADLAVVCKNPSVMLIDAAAIEEVLPVLQKAVGVNRDLVGRFPKFPDYASELGVCLNNLAWTLMKHGRIADARVRAEEAIQWQEITRKMNPKHPIYCHLFINHHLNLADVLAAEGDHEELARRALTMSSIPSKHWIEPYNAACFLGRCMRLAAIDVRLGEEERGKVVESYAGKALNLLEESLRRGFADLKQIKEDSDLDSLRGREGFQKLMTGLEGVRTDQRPQQMQ